MSVISRRDALRAGVIGGVPVAASALAQPQASAKISAKATAESTTTVFDVTAYGAVGDGSTDDTTSIQDALTAAGAVPGSVVSFPPAPGGCYRVSGLTVPGGVGHLVGESTLYCANGPEVVSLTGSVLAPLKSSVTSLLTIGASGAGVIVAGNPHGLTVDGLGFLGTAPSGVTIPEFWAVTVTDTSDVTFHACRDLYCGAFNYGEYPTGGDGSGGFVRFLSSGTGNAFAENGRVLFCSSFGAGTFVLADGLSSAYPGGGSTDGRVVSCQVNGHGYGVVLGLHNAGAGGWAIEECHFSSSPGVNHVVYGIAGNAWTLRLMGCYLDVCSDTHIDCHGRGLQAVGNYFRAQSNATAVRFGSGLSVSGRDPAALLMGNTFDLNGSTSTADFARFNGFTAAKFATDGGGEFRGNLVHNHGAAMPSSWIGVLTGSDGVAIASPTSATLDLVQGPVLSA